MSIHMRSQNTTLADHQPWSWGRCVPQIMLEGGWGSSMGMAASWPDQSQTAEWSDAPARTATRSLDSCRHQAVCNILYVLCDEGHQGVLGCGDQRTGKSDPCMERHGLLHLPRAHICMRGGTSRFSALNAFAQKCPGAVPLTQTHRSSTSNFFAHTARRLHTWQASSPLLGPCKAAARGAARRRSCAAAPEDPRNSWKRSSQTCACVAARDPAQRPLFICARDHAVIANKLRWMSVYDARVGHHT